jgi:hypothetical protein
VCVARGRRCCGHLPQFGVNREVAINPSAIRIDACQGFRCEAAQYSGGVAQIAPRSVKAQSNR